jgi:cytidine deaminase
MALNENLKSDEELLAVAATARKAAYAPYSKFTVGAAVRTKSGKIFSGCNVENISLGLTICAERSAVAAAITAGERDLIEIGIVANSRDPALPCGACRQVLAEFNPTMKIVAATVNGKTQKFDLADLLPKPTQGILESHRDV